MQRVEWIAVLLCSRRVEKVWLRARSQHQKVTLIPLPLNGFDHPRVGIDGDDLRHLYVHVGVMQEGEAQIEGYIVRGEDPGGRLVEQWLKLVIIVLIQQSYANIRIGGDFAGTVQSGETPTYDHDMLFGLRICCDRHGHGVAPLIVGNMENSVVN